MYKDFENTIQMKKSIWLLIIGALIANTGYGEDSFGILKSNEDTLSKSPTFKAGKRLNKGTWSLGGTLSAKSNSYSDIDLLVADIENLDQRAFNLRLEGSYFFTENMSVGLGLLFGENDVNVAIDLMNNTFKREMRTFSRSYSVLGFIKNYVPASASNVFFITNQTELFYDFESGPSETYINDILERKYSAEHSMGLNLRPGILIFFTENFAFDINMGVLGLSFTKEDVRYKYPPNNPPAESDRKESSRNTSIDLTLKFDLLKVGFGFSYYF